MECGEACRYFSWIFSIIVCLSITSAHASEWKDKAEAEGKLTWYASLGATDARRIIDRFKELYPKIDAQFYRAGDAQLMERILAESRAGKYDWDVVSTTGFYAFNLKKRGMLAAYDSPERKFIRTRPQRCAGNVDVDLHQLHRAGFQQPLGRVEIICRRRTPTC